MAHGLNMKLQLFGTKPNQPFVENAIDDHLDIGPNCWSLVTSDDDGWNRIIQFDEKNFKILKLVVT